MLRPAVAPVPRRFFPGQALTGSGAASDFGSATREQRRHLFARFRAGMGEASGPRLPNDPLPHRPCLNRRFGLALDDPLRLLGVLPLPPLTLAGLGLRRRVLGLLRVMRRTVRAAGFTAFPERGFFVLIPCCDPFGRHRILSDAPYTTVAAEMAQREFALARGCVGTVSLIPERQTKAPARRGVASWGNEC